MPPSEELAVLVVGAAGRMGSWAAALLRRTAGFRLVAEVRREDDLAALAAESGAAVGLDVTVAGRGAAHAHTLLERGVRPVVATSGVTPEEVAALDRLARGRGLGGLVVPNLCLGVALLGRAAEEAARLFPAAEIVEAHRPEKRDAPSGTALDLARRIAASRAADGGAIEVPIHSLRLPGVLARHELHFAARGERLVLTHETTERDAFGPGLLLALRHAARADGVALGLEAALEPSRE